MVLGWYVWAMLVLNCCVSGLESCPMHWHASLYCARRFSTDLAIVCTVLFTGVGVRSFSNSRFWGRHWGPRGISPAHSRCSRNARHDVELDPFTRPWGHNGVKGAWRVRPRWEWSLWLLYSQARAAQSYAAYVR